MDLKQIKADRTNGVLVSLSTWDAVLDFAIAMEEKHVNSVLSALDPSPCSSTIRNLTLEEAASAVSKMGSTNPIMSYGMVCASAIRALCSVSTATGKPDGERENG